MMRKKNSNQIRTKIMICIALAVCSLMLMTVAYLQREAKLTNSFVIGNVKAEVQETFQNNIKGDVSVKNTGNVDAYIRAKILVYFVDSKGNITGETPKKDTDYAITLNNNINSSWIYVDNCYYFTTKVSPEQSTDILIKECKPLLNSMVYDGGDRKLVVDIAAEAIQANDRAIQDAWKSVVVENGQLKSKS